MALSANQSPQHQFENPNKEENLENNNNETKKRNDRRRNKKERSQRDKKINPGKSRRKNSKDEINFEEVNNFQKILWFQKFTDPTTLSLKLSSLRQIRES